MRALNERECPICGTTANWLWRPVRHMLEDGSRIWHMKGRFGTKGMHTEILASLLINGRRMAE